MRLIDADARIDDLMERYCKECDKRKGMKNGKRQFIYEIGEAPCRACEVDDVKAELEEAPAIDVPERKVGKWIKDGIAYSLYKCTACNDLCTVAGWANCIPEEQMYKGFKFCPNCGAKMERSEDGET